MCVGMKESGILHKLLSIATHPPLFFTSSPNVPLDKSSGSNTDWFKLWCCTMYMYRGVNHRSCIPS